MQRFVCVTENVATTAEIVTAQFEDHISMR